MSGPYVLVPIEITDALLSSSTIAEPAAGEAVWDPAVSYAVGDRRILTSTHRVYENMIAGVNATSPELTLADTSPRWVDYGPTNRWAAFDGLISTPSTIETTLTYVLRPGLFNGIGLYGLDGAAIDVSIKDAPGGSVFFTYAGELQEPPLDNYDYYFGPIRTLSKLFLRDITPYADPELTITITAAPGVAVKAGMIAIGDLRELVSVPGTGGTKFGATVEPVTFSYIATDKFGVTRIKRRHSATGMRIRVHLPKSDADAALATVQQVLDVPAAFIATGSSGFDGLNCFGLGSGSMSYDGPKHVTFSIDVKGTT